MTNEKFAKNSNQPIRRGGAYDTDGVDHHEGIGFSLSCQPSMGSSVQDNEKIDPYEKYNDNVFDSNEDNILDDTEYLYDYLNQVLGID